MSVSTREEEALDELEQLGKLPVPELQQPQSARNVYITCDRNEEVRSTFSVHMLNLIAFTRFGADINHAEFNALFKVPEDRVTDFVEFLQGATPYLVTELSE